MGTIMINFQKLFCLFAVLFFSVTLSTQYADAQIDTDTTKTYLIIKNDGAEFIGKIISQDSREVVIVTKALGEIVIPKHEIREIRELKEDEITSEGTLRHSDIFSTRYFITTTGASIKKGDSYIIWNLYGPDIQFGVGDKFGVGVMTSWFGSPIIGTAKYSISIGKNSNLGLGTLLGTGSWASPEYGLALPYAALSFGDAQKNISFSVGYGATFGTDISGGRALFSVAGMSKVNDRLSLVFDSFIISGTGNDEGGALLIPGFRFQTDPDKAFQIGFAGVAAGGELIPFPLPMIQWFRKF